MNLSKYEQETIINFNEEDEFADVYTHNLRLIQKLERIASGFPDECTFKERTGYGAYRFCVSKRLVGIHLPRSKEWRAKMKNYAKESHWNPTIKDKKIGYIP